MKNKIISSGVSMLLVLTLLFGINPGIVNAASAPSGIRNNGLGGIYIDINAAPFTTFANYSMGHNAYGTAGCAWYASARVNQLTGKGNTIWSGSSWYNEKYATCGFSRGSTPKAGSIICFSGHVAILEKIEGNTAYVSQGGYPASNPANATYGYCTIDKWDLSKVSSIASGFLGYVYFSGNQPSPQPAGSKTDVWVSTGGADTITEKNATVRGSVGYSGTRPTEAGLYFGTSSGNMKKVAKDTINFSKNPFDLWYDLNSEANQYLSPGTTYYYKMYAIQNGVEVAGETKSFTTTGTAPTPAPAPTPTAQPSTDVWVTTGVADNITQTNAMVRGSAGYSGTRPTEAGLYFGTSPDNMTKVAKDTINFSKNPFDLWYDLNDEAKQYLAPGRTYYYKMYAIQNGKEVCGETKSFTTIEPITPTAQPAPQPTVQPAPQVTAQPTSQYDPPLTTEPTPQPIYTENKTTGAGELIVMEFGNSLIVMVNGSIVSFPDAQPFIDSNDRTQMPVRALTESLGADVEWDESTQTVTIRKDNVIILLMIGSDTIYVNGTKSKMDTAAMTINNRNYIPIRYIAEAMGMVVTWQ